jgi:acetyl/propionyl-CoA carboxylase alpha subunit
MNQFLPDVGVLTHLKGPQGPGIRLDSGYEAGDEIPIFYDPLMAKLIVYAESRELAINKMIKAIERFDLRGVANTLTFCKWLMQHEDFRTGWFDTHFIAKKFSSEMLVETISENETLALAIAISKLKDRGKTVIQKEASSPSQNTKNNWKRRYSTR